MKYENATILTKNALAESLKALILEKPYNKITINEIADKCGLNRKTFYYHFNDKDALLVWTTEHELLPKLQEFNFVTDFKEAVTCILDVAEKNEPFVSTIIKYMNSDDIKNIFIKNFMDYIDVIIYRIEKNYKFAFDITYRNFIKRFFAESILDMIYSNYKYDDIDRDKIIEYYSETFTSAMEGIARNALSGTNLAERK